MTAVVHRDEGSVDACAVLKAVAGAPSLEDSFHPGCKLRHKLSIMQTGSLKSQCTFATTHTEKYSEK